MLARGVPQRTRARVDMSLYVHGQFPDVTPGIRRLMPGVKAKTSHMLNTAILYTPASPVGLWTIRYSIGLLVQLCP
jgi:hypothetical protein